MCPVGARLLAGQGGLLARAHLVAHCLLIESGDELVLVDTGFGTGDVADPKRLGQPFRAAIQPQLRIEDTAVEQVRGLGLDPADVRHIVVTHLDVDHAGGLGDFPNATVHVHAPELATALSPPLTERLRYIPAQWAHGPQWAEHAVDGDSWFGFESVKLLEELEAEVALVPLAGHSVGHSGVAINAGDGWMLHSGDAYFHHGEMATPPSCPPGLRFFQNVVGYNQKDRRANQERLRELIRGHGDEVRVFCSHSPVELARERARQT
jgi:glyoxylase-like metal-dependent hydrolase (beta-lactamase superfamily II)